MFIKKTNELNLNPKDLKNLDSESFKLKQNDDESIFLKKKTTGDTANQQYIILNPKPKKTIINTLPLINKPDIEFINTDGIDTEEDNIIPDNTDDLYAIPIYPDEEIEPGNSVDENAKINLSEEEKEVYEKYEQALSELDGNEKLDMYEFIGELSDDELMNFLSAYDVMNDKDGGMEELVSDMYQTLLNKKGDVDLTAFTRLSNLLSDEEKEAIYDKLNEKMDENISKMTYMRKNGDKWSKTDVPNKTEQNQYRQLFDKQLDAFKLLLGDGDTEGAMKILNKEYVLEFDIGHIVGPDGYWIEEHWTQIVVDGFGRMVPVSAGKEAPKEESTPKDESIPSDKLPPVSPRFKEYLDEQNKKINTPDNENLENLNDAESEIYGRYKEMLEEKMDGTYNRAIDNQATFEFMSELSDEDLKVFLQAYDKAKSSVGGISDLMCDAFSTMIKSGSDNKNNLDLNLLNRLSSMLNQEQKEAVMKKFDEIVQEKLDSMYYLDKDGVPTKYINTSQQNEYKKVFKIQKEALEYILSGDVNSARIKLNTKVSLFYDISHVIDDRGTRAPLGAMFITNGYFDFISPGIH